MSGSVCQDGGCFPVTHWSLVARAGAEAALSHKPALEQLLTLYSPPLLRHIQRRWYIDPDQAQDLLQGFIARGLIERNDLAQADRTRGRFRNFLLTALDHFVANTLRDQRARKRLPEKLLSLDNSLECDAPACAQADPFEIDWARQTVDEALRRMRAECEGSRRMDVWELFEARLRRPIMERTEPVPYPQLVARFGFKSPLQAANLLTTAKRMFQRVLRQVIGEYAGPNGQVEAELQDLIAILSRSAETRRVPVNCH